MQEELIESGRVRINDLYFHIPPESIGITITEYDKSVFLIRESVPTTHKVGRKKIMINLPITIDLEHSSYEVISKLLIQIRKSPIATIENEKIRLEVLGAGNELSTSVAVLIENITCSIDREFPSLLRCDIQMSWFNHLGYSPNIRYVGDVSKGEQPSLRVPKSLYKEFYEYDTIVDGKLINDPSANERLRTDTLEFFYKEYSIGNHSEKDYAAMPWEEDSTPYPLRPGGDPNGWVNAAEKMGIEKADNIYYRWRRMEIPTSQLEGSGTLVLEDLSFSLSTNIAYIPLQGHSVPVPQFMGGAVSQMRAIIFASAETDEKNAPIGTSQKLGKLQKIMQQVSENKFRFSKYAREDFVLVRHPMAKLLKYDKHIEKRSIKDSIYYDEEMKTTVGFSYDEMLPMVSSNRSSKTVEGLPYCSRIQIDLKETRLPTVEDIAQIATEDGRLSRDTFSESWEKTLSALANAHGIAFTNGTFEITEYPKEPTKGIAEKLLEGMNLMQNYYSELTSLDAIMSSDAFLKSSKSLKGRKYQGGLGQTFVLNREGASILVTELLRLSMKKQDGWAKKYQIASTALRHFNNVPTSQSFPDVKLPPGRTSPVYYLQDLDFSPTYKMRAIQGARNLSKEVEDANIALIYGDDAAALRGEVKSAEQGFAIAANDSAIDGDSEKYGGLHTPNDPDHRGDMLTQSIGNATPMGNTLKTAYPTFKVYLKQGKLLFDNDDLSVADLSSRRRRKTDGGMSDLSEHFDISSVIDIRLVKDENEAADLLVLRIASTHKDLVNRTAKEMESNTNSYQQKHDEFISRLGETKEEGKISEAERELAKNGLREGARIQCRLGHETNPNDLGKEFNGKIVSVRGRDIIEVVCMGDGAELIQAMKGVDGEDRFTWNSNTPNLIASMLEDCPELLSFGNVNYKTDFEFQMGTFQFMGGRSALDNIFAPNLFDSYFHIGTKMLSGANFGMMTAQTGFIIGSAVVANTVVGATIGATASAIGTGIVAAGGATGVIVGGIMAFPVTATLIIGAAIVSAIYAGAEVVRGIKRFLMGSPFSIYNQTVWEVLQELTLRHPGTICAVVPFDNRSTIYFGEPNEYYFHRGPSLVEMGILDEGNYFNNSVRETFDSISETHRYKTSVGERADRRRQTRAEVKGKKKLTDKEVAMRLMSPFRRYHLITSESDIISNDIEVTSRGVANSIQVSYPDGSGLTSSNGNFDGSKGFSDYELSEGIKADDDIEAGSVKPKVMTFHNAHNGGVEDMPERYAQALLAKELEGVYRGKLTILGRAGIKPHDVCIIRDTYNEIHGPIGVAKVVHILSPSGGWITEITPKMMVFPANSSGMFQLSMVMKGAAYWLTKDMEQFYTSRRPFLIDGENDILEGIKQLTSYFRDKTSTHLQKGNIGELHPDYVQNFRGDKGIDTEVPAEITRNEGDPMGLALLQTGVAGASSTLGAKLAAGSIPRLAKRAAQQTLLQSGKMIRGFAAAKTVGGGAAAAGGALMNVGKVAVAGGKLVFSATAGVSINIFLGCLVDAYVSWSKYRQPILFYPLSRQGEPWHAAMDGFKNNSELNHISMIASKIANRFSAYKAMMSNVFSYYEGLL